MKTRLGPQIVITNENGFHENQKFQAMFDCRRAYGLLLIYPIIFPDKKTTESIYRYSNIYYIYNIIYIYEYLYNYIYLLQLYRYTKFIYI